MGQNHVKAANKFLQIVALYMYFETMINQNCILANFKCRLKSGMSVSIQLGYVLLSCL